MGEFKRVLKRGAKERKVTERVAWPWNCSFWDRAKRQFQELFLYFFLCFTFYLSFSFLLLCRYFALASLSFLPHPCEGAKPRDEVAEPQTEFAPRDRFIKVAPGLRRVYTDYSDCSRYPFIVPGRFQNRWVRVRKTKLSAQDRRPKTGPKTVRKWCQNGPNILPNTESKTDPNM